MTLASLSGSRPFRILVAAVALVVAIVLYQRFTGTAGAEPPPIDAVTLDGQSVSLAQYRGKVVLIDFWATWCRPCVQEIPHIRKAYDRFHADGFEVLGISLDRDKEALKAFIARERLPWPQILDSAQRGPGQPSVVYGVRAIPRTLLIGRDGRIVAEDLRGSAIESAVARAVAAR